MTEKEKIVFDAIYARRSVREFRNRPVEDDKVEKLLKAAMAAPTACNTQPWEFVVVNEPSAVEELRAAVDFGKYNAPLIIAVCGNESLNPWENDFGIVDCSAAIENMLLAATALDLGSVWIGGYEESAVRKVLDLPQEVHPVGLIYFGYPEGELPEPRTQYLPEAVHYQKYDKSRKPEKRPGALA